MRDISSVDNRRYSESNCDAERRSLLLDEEEEPSNDRLRVGATKLVRLGIMDADVVGTLELRFRLGNNLALVGRTGELCHRQIPTTGTATTGANGAWLLALSWTMQTLVLVDIRSPRGWLLKTMVFIGKRKKIVKQTKSEYKGNQELSQKQQPQPNTCVDTETPRSVRFMFVVLLLLFDTQTTTFAFFQRFRVSRVRIPSLIKDGGGVLCVLYEQCVKAGGRRFTAKKLKL